MTDQDFVMRVLRAIAAGDLYDDVHWRFTPDGAVVFMVWCNDVFDWAVSEYELITPENVYVFERAVVDARELGHRFWASSLFCARVRGERPQGAVYDTTPEALWPLFDACGPKREVGLSNPKKHPEDR